MSPSGQRGDDQRSKLCRINKNSSSTLQDSTRLYKPTRLNCTRLKPHRLTIILWWLEIISTTSNDSLPVTPWHKNLQTPIAYRGAMRAAPPPTMSNLSPCTNGGDKIDTMRDFATAGERGPSHRHMLLCGSQWTLKPTAQWRLLEDTSPNRLVGQLKKEREDRTISFGWIQNISFYLCSTKWVKGKIWSWKKSILVSLRKTK